MKIPFETTSYFKYLEWQFLKTTTLHTLARHLDQSTESLLAMAAKPQYDEFDIPKKNGGLRHIEDPADELKKTLRKLNDYLQAVYYFRKPAAAYGFVKSPDDDPQPCNIKTNAEQHLAKPWMLNADFADFFHQIKTEDVFEIFYSPPFSFDEPLARTVAKLCTYKGRLPMGAPTSPVLSNYATQYLDYDLQQLANTHNITYTRFVDDLTFSSDSSIDESHFKKISYICQAYGLQFNPQKIHYFGPTDPKMVTGLVVSDKIEIPHNYQENLLDEIRKYEIVVEVSKRTGHTDTPTIRRFEQQIEGALAFVRQIESPSSTDYKMLASTYAKTKTRAAQYEPISWLDFGYQNLH